MEDRILYHINEILYKRNKPQFRRVDNTMHLRDEIGMDSLDLAELTVRIENEFGIDIFENGIVNNIAEIIEILKSEN